MLEAVINDIKTLVPASITMLDFLQIFIIWVVLYYCVKSVKGTRAWVLLKGIAIIGIIYALFYVFKLTVLSYIIQSMFSILIIAIVIMLQPDLQKIVEKIGTNSFKNIKVQFKRKKEESRFYSTKTVEEIVYACEDMSKAKTGALIVLERAIPLTEYSDSGIAIGAKISNQLLINTFEKNTPLHDGAVIIRNDKLDSATCYLPLTTSTEVAKSLGTRHRAAIGISEVTDAIVVVVSEETGKVSVCIDGNIKHGLNNTQIYDELNEYAVNQQSQQAYKKKKKKLSIWLQALIFVGSFAIWGIIMNVNDPIISKTINNIPVEIINEDVLTDIDQVYEIVQGSTVTVKVTARRSEIETLSISDIRAVADLSEMSKVYAVPIEISLLKNVSNAEIEFKSDNIMKLKLEDIIQSEIAVTVTTTGELVKNYYLYEASPTITSVIISGPESIIKTIDKAEAVVDITNKMQTTSSTAAIIVYDKNGNIINSEHVTISKKSTPVKIEIYKTKIIKGQLILTDTQNYQLINYKIPSIIVAANDEILDSLDTIDIKINPKEIDIAAGKLIVNLSLYLPENVYLPETQESNVEIEFSIEKVELETEPTETKKGG